MKNFLNSAPVKQGGVLLIVVLAFLFISCKEDVVEQPDFNVSGIVLPKSIEVTKGGSYTLSVVGGKGPVATDIVRLVSASENSFDCLISACADKEFTFNVHDELTTGEYSFYIVRGDKSQFIGKIQINIVVDIVIEPDEGVTVYGIVECDGTGIRDVVVSDGYEVTTTDENGIYQLKSEKKHGYVFISVPSGYEVLSDGVLPKFHQYLAASAEEAERADFHLTEAGDQTNHTMLVFGDIHLADRTNDRNQFREFTSDVNDWLSANSGGKVYGLTLGDMSWDVYWLKNSYDLNNYLNDMNAISGLQVFHTIGNHDHEMNAAGDFNTVVKYKKIIAPTSYSFNIGNIHYIVLDDIECTNPGDGDRTYNVGIVSEQIDWLEKDLSFVSKDTPLVVATHAPLYNNSGTYNFNIKFLLTTTPAFVNAVKDYPEVQLLTGHTHKVYNVDKLDDNHIFEHNSGAVCATWWWSGYETPGIHIGQDGAPGGYRIMNIDGKNFKWVYKPTGKSTDEQFRTYDGNEILLSENKYVPNATADGITSFNKIASGWQTASTDNYVYINIWDYDPQWEISVTENGKELQWNQVEVYDPLHIVSYTAKRLNKGSAATFATEKTKHIFRVKASAADTPLDITVTDRFGNVYRETMTRPKAFDTDTYK